MTRLHNVFRLRKLSGKFVLLFLFTVVCVGFVNLALFGQNDTVKNKSELTKFEIDFAEYRISRAGTGVASGDSVTVHLFGFLTMPDTDRNTFGEQKQSGAEKVKEKVKLPLNFYLSSDLSTFRLYTFLRDGEVKYKGKSYTADARGIIKLPSPVDVSKIRILGKKTAKGNIAGGKHPPLSSFYQYADRRIAVYELGVKTADDMNDSRGRADVLRSQADMLRNRADTLRSRADVLRRRADTLRRIADERRRIAYERRIARRD